MISPLSRITFSRIRAGVHVFFAVSLLFWTISPVFAAVDPAVLSQILQQLSGEPATAATGTTTTTGNATTGTTTNTGNATSNTGTANGTAPISASNVSPASTSTTNTSTSASTSTTSTSSSVSAEVDHLEISMGSPAKAGVDVSITVQAKTKNNALVNGYRGTILIQVANDSAAKVPYVNGYTFNALDSGKKTFSSGLVFSKAGTFTVRVYDFEKTNVTGSYQITVAEKTIQNSGTSTQATDTEVNTNTATSPISTSVSTIASESNASSTTTSVPAFQIVKVETGDRKATLTFRVANDVMAIQKFEFNYIDQSGKRGKSLSFDKDRIRQANGDYVWYLPNLEVSKYSISIAGIGADGTPVTGAQSAPFTADLSLMSAEKCIIPTVSGIGLTTQSGKSILSWDSIPEAIRYKVYKKDSNGNFAFIEGTQNTYYTVHVSDGAVRYDEFSVKAVCSDGTESVTYAPSTRVQTGPTGLVLLGIVSLVIGFAAIRKRKNLCKI